MATRTVIDVEVNDEAFNRFAGAFTKYADEVKKIEAAQKKGGAAQEGWQKRSLDLESKMNKERERAVMLADKMARGYETMSRKSKELATSLRSATDMLLRWSSTAWGLAGVGTGVGLFGMGMLGHAASSGRKASLGAGASYGGMSAFETQFGPSLEDPSGFLRNVGMMQRNRGMRNELYTVGGFSTADIEGKKSDELAAEYILKLKDLVDRTEKGNLGVLRQQYGITGASEEDLLRLKEQTRADIEKQYSGYGKARSELEVSKAAQDKWTDFMVKLETVGKLIQTTLINQLVPLAGPLANLGEKINEFILKFINSETMGRWIADVSEGLKDLGNTIDSGGFRKGFDDFLTNLKELNGAVAEVIKFIKHPLDYTWDAATGAATRAGQETRRAWENAPSITEGYMGGDGKFTPWNRRELRYPMPPIANPVTHQDEEKILDMYRDLERSGSSAVSPKGAIGRYQLMPSNIRAYGYRPEDVIGNDALGRELARKLHREHNIRFKGNLTEDIIAYNAGPNAVQKYREGGLGALPKETQDYVRRAAAMDNRVQINISNSTSANVDYNIANQAASTTVGVR